VAASGGFPPSQPALLAAIYCRLPKTLWLATENENEKCLRHKRVEPTAHALFTRLRTCLRNPNPFSRSAGCFALLLTVDWVLPLDSNFWAGP